MITRFFRHSGVIAYSLRIGGPDGVSSVANDLLASGIQWLWFEPVAWNIADNPCCVLSSASRDDFITSYQSAMEEDAAAIFVGISPDLPLYSPSFQTVKPLVAEFVMDERGPVKLVVVHVADKNDAMVFAPHNPSPAAAQLLAVWGVRPGSPFRDYSYQALNILRLEVVFQLWPH